VDAAVSSRHGILRLYDDQDVGIQFVHVHPVLAVRTQQKMTKWPASGLAGDRQISSSNRENTKE
jgi:hypothetical protein